MDLSKIENAKLETAVEVIAGHPVLKVAGEIDLYTAPEFKSAIISLIESGSKHVIVDLSKVSYMDSGGFGVLLGAVRRVRPLGGSVALVGCTGSILRILKITRLDTIFTLCSTVEEAIHAIEQNKAQ